jgi:hypothetical protein
MRRRIAEGLAAYRASSCQEAIDKIDGALRQQKGRWHERTEQGALPPDLMRKLAEAELWAQQSEAVCKGDPAAPRFNSLRALTHVIWQYPKSISREKLDEQLRLLDH